MPDRAAGGLVLDRRASVNRLFSIASGTTLHPRKATLAGGPGPGASSSGHGGAIYNAGTLTLTDCTVPGNVVPSGKIGGGIYSTGSPPA